LPEHANTPAGCRNRRMHSAQQIYSAKQGSSAASLQQPHATPLCTQLSRLTAQSKAEGIILSSENNKGKNC